MNLWCRKEIAESRDGELKLKPAVTIIHGEVNNTTEYIDKKHKESACVPNPMIVLSRKLLFDCLPVAKEMKKSVVFHQWRQKFSKNSP
jgi:hypothetical protein